MRTAGMIIAILGIIGVGLALLGFIGTAISPAIGHVDFDEQIPAFVGSVICCGLSAVPLIGGLVLMIMGSKPEGA